MTATRRQQIVQLLRSLHDFDYDGVRDSLASLKVRRGPAPSRRVECPDCGGEGKRRIRGFDAPCERCGGHRVSDMLGNLIGNLVLGRGWIEVDAYTERPVSTADAPQPEPTRTVPCDACGPLGEDAKWRRHGSGTVPRLNARGDRTCLRCDGTGVVHVPLSLLNGHGPGAKLERTGDAAIDAAARRERYSFAELDAALTELARAMPGARRLLYDLFETGTKDEAAIPPPERCKLEAGLAFLDSLLPAELRVPSYARAAETRTEQRRGKAVNKHQRAKRDQEIRRRKAAGEGPATICMAYGISRTTFYEIVKADNGGEVAA